MSELSAFYRRTAHYLAGQIGLFFVGFVSFPVFTRVFSVPQYGLISLTLNTVAIATVLSKLGLQFSTLRFYPQYAHSPDPDAKRRYCSTLFWSATSIAAGVTLAFVLGVRGLPHGWISSQMQRLLLLAAVLVFVRAITSIVMNLWRAEGKSKTFNVVDVATRGGTVAAICMLVFTWERSPRAFFIGMIAVEVAVMLWMISFLRRRRLLAFGVLDGTCFKAVVAFGLPMIIFELSSLILDTGDRFLVEYYLGAKALGCYAAAYNLSSYTQQALVTPLNLAIFPVYMNLWVTKGREETQSFLSQSLDRFLLIAIGLVAGVTVIGRDALVFLSSQRFEEASHLVPVLVAGLLVYGLSVFLNAGLNVHNRTHAIAKFVVYSCALNMALNVWLIPRIGLQGAAIATLLSYAFLIVQTARQSLALLPLRVNAAACAKYALAATLAALSAWRFGFHNAFVDLVTRGVSFVALYFGILWLVDRRVRQLEAEVVRLLFPRISNSELVVRTGVCATKGWKGLAGTVGSFFSSLSDGK